MKIKKHQEQLLETSKLKQIMFLYKNQGLAPLFVAFYDKLWGSEGGSEAGAVRQWDSEAGGSQPMPPISWHLWAGSLTPEIILILFTQPQ